MTRFNFPLLHRDLWTWALETHGDQAAFGQTSKWPGWERNGGQVPTVAANCFACQVKSMRSCAGQRPAHCPLLNGPCTLQEGLVDGESRFCLDKHRSDSGDSQGLLLASTVLSLPWSGPRYFALDGTRWSLWAPPGKKAAASRMFKL